MSSADPSPEADDAEADTDSADGAIERRRGGRVLTVAGFVILGLVVLGVAWVLVTGLIARSELNQAREDIARLRGAVLAGDTARAERLVSDITERTGSAHALTSGPAWWVAANVPVLGSPLRTTRVIATEADRVGDDVLPGVLRLATTLPDSARSSAGAIDLDALAEAAGPLHRAAVSAESALATIDATDGSWLSAVDDARAGLATQLGRVQGELTGADRAVRVLLPMLGRDGPQRYFVGFLNEAESRGGGGIPGAFAVVSADRGRITFEKFGTDDDLRGARADVDLGPDFTARYRDNDPQGTIQNSNLSPDFSYAARIWAGMWQDKTGERIDGALALDPTALSYLLRATGAVRLADGTVVSHRNVVALTQQTQYTRFPGTSAAVNDQRKAFLTGLAKAISTHLTSAKDPVALVKAVSLAASQRRFVVWSSSPTVEADLRTARWAGQLGNDTPTPYAGFVVNNAAGSKLDYYLRRTMTYSRTECGAGGTATATLRLTNSAPRSGLPAYVTYRADTPPAGARPGDNRLLVTYYADRSATIDRLTVDGAAAPLFPQNEGTTVAATTTVEIPAGATVTVRVTVTEPRADGQVTVLAQPLARPLTVDLDGDRCR